nr:probable protein phosphatase 2C 35 [Ipomoea batatas]
MGCIHGKCCSRYPSSSDEESREELGPYGQTHILTNRSLDVAYVPCENFKLEYSVLTQRGFYPDFPEKENQDSYCIRRELQGNPNIHFFGVFDGHGQFGTECSGFVKDRLVEILSNDVQLVEDPVRAYISAFSTANEELHSSNIDDSMSGTTAITALVIGDMLYVANVGQMSERVKLCGASVLTVDQVEGNKDPSIQAWGDEETGGDDPPRLWVPNEKYPGTAFTRSVGDSVAENIGVVADPEVLTLQLTANYPFFVLASDGVFEFISSQTVVDMVSKYEDPRDACSAIAGEAYKLWLEHDNRTDDITIIIVQASITDMSGGKGLNMEKGTIGIYSTPGSKVMMTLNCTLVILFNYWFKALWPDSYAAGGGRRRWFVKELGGGGRAGFPSDDTATVSSFRRSAMTTCPSLLRFVPVFFASGCCC